MKHPKILLAYLFSASLVVAQTPYNSILYGVLEDHLDASTVSHGQGELTPSHHSQLSLANPATWTLAEFALLSGHYSGGEVTLNGPGFRSSYGRLSYASFILPIMEKWAFGLGLRPFSRKNFLFEDDSVSTIVFSGDTLLFSKTLEGSGGISSLFAGGGWRFTDRLAFGLRLDFLMGVFDEDITGTVDNLSAIYRRHFEVKGTLLSVFAQTQLFEEPLPLTGFGMVQIPVGRREIRETDFYPYRPSSLKKMFPGPVHELSLPVRLAGGLRGRVSDHLWVSLEIQGSRYGDDLPTQVSSMGGDLADGFRISLGLLRSGDRSSENPLGRFHYRIGFYERQHYISRGTDALQERGLGLGVGIPFAPTGNQIDVGFRFSSRDGFLSDDSEIHRQLTIGLTLGDVWLVKRKRR